MKYIMLIATLMVIGCDNATTGWDPATMRCRLWEGGKPVGDFLPDERCTGQTKPAVVEPEPQP